MQQPPFASLLTGSPWTALRATPQATPKEEEEEPVKPGPRRVAVRAPSPPPAPKRAAPARKCVPPPPQLQPCRSRSVPLHARLIPL